MQNEKIELTYEDPGSRDLIVKVLKTFLSFAFYKRLLYSFAYNILNYHYGYLQVNRGKNVKIRPHVMFRHPERIFLEDNVRINTGCKIWGGKKQSIVKIGSGSKISPNVFILAFNHKILKGTDSITNQSEYIDSDVIIGKNVWIGANATILPGCNIGDGTVVAAGSVVSKTLPKNTICAGVPAKVIKHK